MQLKFSSTNNEVLPLSDTNNVELEITINHKDITTNITVICCLKKI